MAFNKMMILVPAMLAARKLDGDDPDTVYWLRVAYGTIQCICILLAVYTYIQASAVALSTKSVVYVPPAPAPFADPNEKKKYTEVPYGIHVLSTARSLIGSTIFGIVLTVALHLYKGMIVGLAIQTIMGPLNLLENALVKAIIFGNGIRIEDKIFNEKFSSDIIATDDIIDQNGNPIIHAPRKVPKKGSFEELLLDTWDSGGKADINNLINVITESNCNYQCDDTGWTPLMIVAGLNAKGTISAIRHLLTLNVNLSMIDAEGWNALHWAAFHSNLEAVRQLIKEQISLSYAKDKDGKIPLDLAQSEGNDDIVMFLENYTDSRSSSNNNDNNNTNNDATTTTTTTTDNNENENENDPNNNNTSGLRKRK